MDCDNWLTQLFARHIAEEPDPSARSVEFGLVHHLIEQRRFTSVDALLVYCRDPRNLREFLPDRRDQTLFSRRLVRRLTTLRGKPGDPTQPRPAGPDAAWQGPDSSARPAL